MKTALKLPPLIGSRYIPIRLIGKGGMGAVYEVEHTRTGDRLALKVLHSALGTSGQAVERFKREARASVRIKSEYVVRVTDADVAPELEDAPFLVMELLDGMDLERAANVSPPTPETVVRWLRQVAQAVDEAHRLGIIHRDLKPENLFLATVDGHRSMVKVLDFGIAKMIEEGTGVTGAGQMLGTPKYMSPEQASPNAPVTPATDRCALGLIAYRLLVGESYYQGGAMGILGQVLHADLQPPSACGSRFGAAFDDWFMKACHRNPEQRFASATEQIEALAEALGVSRRTSDVTRPAATLTAPVLMVDRSRSRRPFAVGFLVAGGLAAVSLAGVVLKRGAGTGFGVISTASVAPAPAARPAPELGGTAASPPMRPRPQTLKTPVSADTDSPAQTRPLPPPSAPRPGGHQQPPRSLRPRRAEAASVARAAPPTEKARADDADPYAEQKWARPH